MIRERTLKVGQVMELCPRAFIGIQSERTVRTLASCKWIVTPDGVTVKGEGIVSGEVDYIVRWTKSELSTQITLLLLDF